MKSSLGLCLLVILATSTALPAQNPKVRLDTSLGTIVLELDVEKAEATVNNFLEYTKAGFYDGTIFHRVIDGFMVQGGGFDANLNKKETREPIRNEANNGLSNARGTIAMARTPDPHSATAQFFINTVDNAGLDHTAETQQGWGYAVFGKVIEGMEVVDKISKVETGTQKGMGNVPTEAVIIKKVTVE